jgi:hypothetical protein
MISKLLIFISETTQIGYKIAIYMLKGWPFFVSHRINMGKENQKSLLSMTRPTPSGPPSALSSKPPNIQSLLMGASSFNR